MGVVACDRMKNGMLCLMLKGMIGKRNSKTCVYQAVRGNAEKEDEGRLALK